MITRLKWFVLALLLAFAGPVMLSAQQEVTPPAETPAEEEIAPEPSAQTVAEEPAPALSLAQDDEFEQLASRAEQLAQRDDASLFAIGRLRSELVDWRDRFLDQTTVNAGRLNTVAAQLEALGPVPESGEEAAVIAARRAELIAQQDALRAPRILAQEAYARANGIIAEFDSIVLQRETAQLGVRGPIPLNPVHLMAALTAITSLVQAVTAETAAEFHAMLENGQLWQVLPRALALFALGLGLMIWGRRVVTRWRNTMTVSAGRWRTLRLFAVSLAQLAVPLIGLVAMTEAVTLLNIAGLRGTDVLEAIPQAGACVVFGWWLARQVFPEKATGYLGYAAATRQQGRRYTGAIAWVMALRILLNAGLRTFDLEAGPAAALDWPILVVLGLLFWRLGLIIKTPPESAEQEETPQPRMRGLVGRASIAAAIIAPMIAGFGFVAGGQALLIPAIVSVALIGVLVLLQRIGHDLTRVAPTDEDDGRGLMALVPVFLSFVIYVLSLPVFALIWGARVDDLTELWTQFREGFSIGETQISPTDFLTFAFVFAAGYILTRFIQGTLRKSVMPRTRLDLGGQNAVVAGVGYVGILLAAIIAITSAGIDLSNLAIVAGALSVGIGFGLQNIVSNFVSGIILLIERPVSEGDWIEVGGQMGYVRAISVRSTRIETFDRTDVIIPNADLVSGQVTNWTRGNLIGRVIVPVGVAYGTDVDKVTAILTEIAEAHPLVVMTPPPAVLFQGFGADSLDFEIRAILRDVNYVMVAKSEMNHEIAKKFAEAGIEIPFAQRDIWLRNPEVLKGDA
ncbi:MAG: DUF3772 domain-containing protein [Yoonia sp.]|uniref:DUF3772 domain-containing protein n=1 Tax=Yoonia sp. TaxID=2212373 RepID=UPI003EF58194